MTSTILIGDIFADKNTINDYNDIPLITCVDIYMQRRSTIKQKKYSLDLANPSTIINILYRLSIYNHHKIWVDLDEQSEKWYTIDTIDNQQVILISSVPYPVKRKQYLPAINEQEMATKAKSMITEFLATGLNKLVS